MPGKILYQVRVPRDEEFHESVGNGESANPAGQSFLPAEGILRDQCSLSAKGEQVKKMMGFNHPECVKGIVPEAGPDTELVHQRAQERHQDSARQRSTKQPRVTQDPDRKPWSERDQQKQHPLDEQDHLQNVGITDIS